MLQARTKAEELAAMDDQAEPSTSGTTGGHAGPHSTDRLRVSIARTRQRDGTRAIAELAEEFGSSRPSFLILFASPTADPESLGAAIAERFPCPVLACTTAGEITADEGYSEGGIVAAAAWSPELSARTVFIESLSAFAADPDPAALRDLPAAPGAGAFALLVVDGLSMSEEVLAARLHSRLGGIPLVGGSAGDGLDFRRTGVYHDGRFRQDAAVLLVCETPLPFHAFRTQHFEATNEKLVITGAEGSSRRVFEINGLPAAAEYARAVGLSPGDLDPQVFAAHPVMLRIGGEYFVRSIQKVNPDGSLTFFCAIDEGLVLTVARPGSLAGNLRTLLSDLETRVPRLGLVLGCDCILRRLETDRRGERELVREILRPYPFIGFSSYGEQFGGIHVNHTLTGLALGG